MFDLSKASDKFVGSGKVYQQPGISEDVIITSIKNDASAKGNKYIQMETKGANDELGRTPQMYLTDAAFPMTARNLVDLLIATNNVSEDEAKEMVKVDNEVTLVNKLSALLVGKKFRAKFKGEQSSTGTVFAQLGGSESMRVPKESSKLFFNPVKDIKKYEGTLQPRVAQMEPATADKNDDLPF